MRNGVQCIRDEWERAFKAGTATQVDMENLDYVLNAAAGCSDKRFQNRWQRDRAEDGSLLPTRMRADGTGMRLPDFVAHPEAVNAQLTEAQVLVLRLYTTAAFRSINTPLRNLARTMAGDIQQPPRLEQPHPLPCTVVLIYEALKKLRANIQSNEGAPPQGSRDSQPSTDGQLELGVRLRPSASSDAGEEGDGLELSACTPVVKGQSNRHRRSRVGVAISVDRALVGDSSGPPLLTGLQARSMRSDEVDAAVERHWSLPQQLVRRFCASARVLLRQLLEVARPRDGALERLTNSVLLPSQRSRGRATHEVVLWRGMRDLQATSLFMQQGGSELAPCSTTTDVHVALRYARDWTPGHGRGQQALIFRVLLENFLQQAPDLVFLSAFPHEKEALYPPLTLFKPLGKAERLTFDETEFVVVTARATFPS